MEEFKEYYKFPLKVDTYGYNKVWDVSGQNNALDFAMQMLFEEKIANVDKPDKEKIIRIINGEDLKIKNDFIFTLDKGVISLNNMPFILIRGWGRLIGTGGYNLPSEKACEIQDEFGKYVLEKLQNAVVNES